jgi:hypothetical protein
MKLSEVLRNLYSYDANKMINTVNASVFAKDYPYDNDTCSIIHTGFVFEMQHGKEMELFYDLVNGELIRQPRFSELPAVLGLVYVFWNGWIKVWDHKIILHVNEEKDEYIITSFENAGAVYGFTTFEIIAGGSGEIFTFHPLTKCLDGVLFFNGSTFELSEYEDEEW